EKLPNNLEETLSVIKEKLLSHMEENTNQEDMVKGVKEMKMNIESMENNIITALNMSSVLLQKGCSEKKGFFTLPGSKQCFKVFKSGSNFEEAEANCRKEGLKFAKPFNAVLLRNHINQRYGSSPRHYFVGARGDGTGYKWIQGGSYLMPGSPLWFTGANGKSKHCLLLGTNDDFMERYPTAAYTYTSCGATNFPHLCELIME
ncbi:unnamed protein product, partial [Meganyctiphanes norvegica]